MNRKFIKIWSSTYRCNIDVESTWIQRGVPVGVALPTFGQSPLVNNKLTL